MVYARYTRPAGQTAPTPPDLPTSLFPVDDGTLTEGSVVFSWTASPTAARYQLLICTDPAMATGCRPVVTSADLTQTVPLAPGVYHWRLYSGTAANPDPSQEAWTQGPVRKLTVVARALPPTELAVPRPIRPVGGATVYGRSFSPRWSAVPGADRYEITVCQATAACRTVTYASVAPGAPASTEYEMPVALEADGDHTWSVRALSATGPVSASSVAQAFRVAPPKVLPTPTLTPTPTPTTTLATTNEGFRVPGPVWLAIGAVGGYVLFRVLSSKK